MPVPVVDTVFPQVQRHPVENLLELLASGMTSTRSSGGYPESEREDLLAALEFAALASGSRRVTPLGAA